MKIINLFVYKPTIFLKTESAFYKNIVFEENNEGITTCFCVLIEKTLNIVIVLSGEV